MKNWGVLMRRVSSEGQNKQRIKQQGGKRVWHIEEMGLWQEDRVDEVGKKHGLVQRLIWI